MTIFTKSNDMQVVHMIIVMVVGDDRQIWDDFL